METKLEAVRAEPASCSEHLTFGQYLWSQVDAAKKALESRSFMEQNDLELPIEELVVKLAEQKLPEVRSVYELVGFVHFFVAFDNCDPGFYQAAEELWEMYETVRDEANT